ncbi:hypothetical protein [Roseibium sp.]|uniref:hypothetical protein n=1 Tax=Roseibium sp. TaxID=1936156 RepID=UPI003D0D3D3D
MKTHPLPSVDSQVLYRNFQPLPGETIFDFIAEAAGSVGFHRKDCALLKTSTDLDIRVLAGNFHILVTQTVPFENAAHLKPALETFTVRAGFPEAPGIVRETRACTQISVRKGVLPHQAMPKDLLAAVGPELTTFCDSRETQVAMTLARKITELVTRRSDAGAVFWGPSVYFLKPDTFLAYASSGSPLDLYLHPIIHGQADPDTGEPRIGVMGCGAPWLIGNNVEYKPCALPPEYLVETLCAFVAFSQKRDALFSHGDVFGRDENEKIRLIYHPNEEDGVDTIELKVVHNPAFGILREQVPTIQKHYSSEGELTEERIHGAEEVELNPDDPVDAAILERLAAQSALAAASAPYSHPTDNVSSAPAEIGLQAPETQAVRAPQRNFEGTPVQKPRLSMNELRKIAQQPMEPLEEPAAGNQKKGFLGRLFGTKTT